MKSMKWLDWARNSGQFRHTTALALGLIIGTNVGVLATQHRWSFAYILVPLFVGILLGPYSWRNSKRPKPTENRTDF